MNFIPTHSQETVSKLISSFFKEDKTRRELANILFVKLTEAVGMLQLNSTPCVAVSGDATLLMAEMLKIFVQGK